MIFSILYTSRYTKCSISMSKKHEKFVELAEKRTRKTLKNIDLIGNLANKNNYEYSKADVEAIFGAIEEALKQSRSRFRVDNIRDFKLR